jgi:pSer/pThr/pTyr-binding forkhead associated (FHA) protein
MRAQLNPLDGGPSILITRDLTLVGRKEDCDLRLDHKSVSKLHCVIVKTDGLLLLRDLGSTNGTRVNGQRVRRAALLPNDELTIAGFKFKVHLGPEEGAAPNFDMTQQMNPQEVVHLMRKGAAPAVSSKPASEARSLPLQPNLLPDVYSEDERPPESDS